MPIHFVLAIMDSSVVARLASQSSLFMQVYVVTSRLKIELNSITCNSSKCEQLRNLRDLLSISETIQFAQREDNLRR